LQEIDKKMTNNGWKSTFSLTDAGNSNVCALIVHEIHDTRYDLQKIQLKVYNGYILINLYARHGIKVLEQAGLTYTNHTRDAISIYWTLGRCAQLVETLMMVRLSMPEDCFSDMYTTLCRMWEFMPKDPYIRIVAEIAAAMSKSPDLAIDMIAKYDDRIRDIVCRILLDKHINELNFLGPDLVIAMIIRTNVTKLYALDIAEYCLAESRLDSAYMALNGVDDVYANTLRARIVESMMGMPMQTLPNVPASELMLEMIKAIRGDESPF
jgi:hypothetical protein